MKKAFVIMLACLMAVPAFCGNKERGNKEEKEDRGKSEFAGQKGGSGGHEGSIIDMCLKSDKMREELGLTEEQVEKLKTLSERTRTRQKELSKQREKHGMEQARAMMDKDPADVDEDTIMKNVEEAGRAQIEMNKLRMKELIELNKVLTGEQRQKMREMRKKREQKMREMRDRMEERKDGEDGKDSESRREEMRKKWQERKKQQDKDGKDEDNDSDNTAEEKEV